MRMMTIPSWKCNGLLYECGCSQKGLRFDFIGGISSFIPFMECGGGLSRRQGVSRLHMANGRHGWIEDIINIKEDKSPWYLGHTEPIISFVYCHSSRVAGQ